MASSSARTPIALRHELTATEAKAFGRLVSGWAKRWEVQGLAERVRIRFSKRLRSTWARAVPERLLVTLSDRLRAEPPARRAQVLCHEVAHLAVHLRHGRRAKPHGSEWQALVEAAGFPAVRRLAGPVGPVSKPPRHRYEHRCPVCQTHRTAARRVPAWRCAACTRAGLPGHLTITRLA